MVAYTLICLPVSDTVLDILHTCIPSSLQCSGAGDINIAILKMGDTEAQLAQCPIRVNQGLESSLFSSRVSGFNDTLSTLDHSLQFLSSSCCH